MTLNSWNQKGGEDKSPEGRDDGSWKSKATALFANEEILQRFAIRFLNFSALKAIFEAIVSISNGAPGSKKKIQHHPVSPDVGMLLLHYFFTSQTQRMRRNIPFELMELH